MNKQVLQVYNVQVTALMHIIIVASQNSSIAKAQVTTSTDAAQSD